MLSLADDFKACRKRLNISLEEVSKKTRVPVSLFASIEDGTIFENQAFTRTYVRSFTRMYGKALKLDENDVLRALNEHEAEMYSGFLYRKYVLGEVEKPVEVRTLPHLEEQLENKVATSDEIAPKNLAPKTPIDKPTPPRTPIESDRSVDWARMSTRFSRTSGGSSNALYLAAALVLVILLAALVYVFLPSDSPENDPSDNLSAQVQDTTRIAEPTQSQPVAETVAPMATSLPDTLRVTVYAINDKLDPVRISSDLKDKVNPYWIEVGAGRIFEFRDTIVVRADSRRFALIYNGHLIRSLNEFRFDADSLNFRLTRTLLQQRPESQRSGSLPEGVRPPILDF